VGPDAHLGGGCCKEERWRRSRWSRRRRNRRRRRRRRRSRRSRRRRRRRSRRSRLRPHLLPCLLVFLLAPSTLQTIVEGAVLHVLQHKTSPRQ
jgi:ABC-type Fe3+ transport system permease subunit